MLMASFRWFWQFQDSCGCRKKVGAGSTWLIVVLFYVGWSLPVPDGSGRSRPDLWILLPSTSLMCNKEEFIFILL